MLPGIVEAPVLLGQIQRIDIVYDDTQLMNDWDFHQPLPEASKCMSSVVHVKKRRLRGSESVWGLFNLETFLMSKPLLPSNFSCSQLLCAPYSVLFRFFVVFRAHMGCMCDSITQTREISLPLSSYVEVPPSGRTISFLIVIPLVLLTSLPPPIAHTHAVARLSA